MLQPPWILLSFHCIPGSSLTPWHCCSCDSLPWEHLSHWIWGWNEFVSCLSAVSQFSDAFPRFACLISAQNVREEHHLFHTAVEMERYQKPQQMLALVFCTCFLWLCAASQDPKPVWQQTQTVIQVIKDCSWTGGEIILFSITLVWKWSHLLWGNSRPGTASPTCASSGKCRIRARKQPRQQKPKEKSPCFWDAQVLPDSSYSRWNRKQKDFFPSCLTMEVLV